MFIENTLAEFPDIVHDKSSGELIIKYDANVVKILNHIYKNPNFRRFDFKIDCVKCSVKNGNYYVGGSIFNVDVRNELKNIGLLINVQEKDCLGTFTKQLLYGFDAAPALNNGLMLSTFMD